MKHYMKTKSKSQYLFSVLFICSSLILNSTIVFAADVGAVPDIISLDEDSSITFDLLANDVPPLTSPIALVGLDQPKHGSLDWNDDNTVTYTPEANYNGSDSFNYSISNTTGASIVYNSYASITVRPINDAPIINDDNVDVNQDVYLNIDVLLNDEDIDDDVLDVAILSDPSHGSVELNANRSITYKPAFRYYGSDSFSYSITDAGGVTLSATVYITVNKTSDIIAYDDKVTTNEDEEIVIQVIQNDIEANGQTFFICYYETPKHGIVYDNGNETLLYVPDPDFNGVETFEYSITNSEQYSTAQVTVTVKPVNDAPDAVDDQVHVRKDAASSLNVLENDIDIDGDKIHIMSFTNPSHGKVSVNADNTITYTSNKDYLGIDTFTYTISDVNDVIDTATVTINVEDTKLFAISDQASTRPGKPVIITVLKNDESDDYSSLSVTEVKTPAHGKAIINSDDSITYTPQTDYTGQEIFTYTISDKSKFTSTANIIIQVVNSNPVAITDLARTRIGKAVTIDVLDNDKDGDSDTLALTTVSSPSHGTVVMNADSSITYMPQADYVGKDAFIYTIVDDYGASATGEVTVSVFDLILLKDNSLITNMNYPIDINVFGNDVMDELDMNTFEISEKPLHGIVTIHDDYTVTYTPDKNYYGPDSFTYSVRYHDGTITTSTIRILVIDSRNPETGNPQTGNLGLEITPIIFMAEFCIIMLWVCVVTKKHYKVKSV